MLRCWTGDCFDEFTLFKETVVFTGDVFTLLVVVGVVDELTIDDNSSLPLCVWETEIVTKKKLSIDFHLSNTVYHWSAHWTHLKALILIVL